MPNTPIPKHQYPNDQYTNARMLNILNVKYQETTQRRWKRKTHTTTTTHLHTFESWMVNAKSLMSSFYAQSILPHTGIKWI